MNKNNIDISLIQEPWVNSGKVQGINQNDFNLFYTTICDLRPRSCIIAKKSIKAFLLHGASDEDTTVIKVEDGLDSITLVSAYLAHDKEIPSRNLDEITQDYNNLILGCDANARNTIWGSKETNERGEYLADFISKHNLNIHNRGNIPTFEFPASGDVPGWKAIIDVTLSKSSKFDLIENWKVSSEDSFSDHKYILYDIGFNITKALPYRNPRKTNWNQFKNKVSGKIKSTGCVNLSIEDIERETLFITETLKSAFEASCPVTKAKNRQLPPYFNKELIELRRRMRNQFNWCNKNGDWDEYRNIRNLYKKERRKAKSKSWKDYCEGIESTKDTSRLRKILAKSHTSPAFVKKNNGLWAESSKETNELLLDTHFPGCEEIADGVVNGAPEMGVNTLGSSIITLDKVMWAINSHGPFKSAGLDGIFPKMLQVCAKQIAPLLKNIFTGCINLNYIPTLWKEVKVIYIPKAGKANHCTTKDYRPISLSSFLLKTLERIIDIHIRNLFKPDLIAKTQHAYMKGKSVDTALHETVRTIESSLQYNQFTLAAFLDIEGAFNNVSIESIEESLSFIEVEKPLQKWISGLLRNRIIHSSVGNSNLKRLANRGTPQGGVLSPLLWLLVINKILIKLKGISINVVAYADDVVLLVSGLFPQTLSERIEVGLNILTKWAESCGLGVNPNKTELVLFRKGYNIPTFKLPSMRGATLELSNKTKFLGVILDSRLTWKDCLEDRIKKAQIAYFVCRKAISKSWGLSPKSIYWIFTAVIQPILTYGCSVWWTALLKECNSKKLDTVVRNVCLGVTGALRSTSTDSLLNILSIPPSNLYTRFSAARTAARLVTVGLWTTKPYGHSKILDFLNIKMPNQIDQCIPKISFTKNYRIRLPERKQWQEENPVNEFSTVIFTDGSKMSTGCGAGFHVSDGWIRRSYRLPNDCSIFQCEIYAIKMASKAILDELIEGDKVALCVDSQAALKALDSPLISSILVSECIDILNKVGERHELTLIWVPGHYDIEGNDIADSLAKCGANKHISWKERVPAPLTIVYNQIKQKLKTDCDKKWQISSGVYRYTWGIPSKDSSNLLMSFNKFKIRKIIFAITGHWTIGRHARRMGITERTDCPSCGLTPQETDAFHFWCMCPSLCRLRWSLFGNFWLNSLEELKNIPLSKRIDFILNTKWFNKE